MGTSFWRTSMFLLTATIAVSATSRNYDANYVSTPPVIDGAGTDAAWATASSPATGFVQHNAIDVISQEQTSVRVLWDDTHLYLLYEAEDGAIVPSATGNDTGFAFNNVDDAEFFFDPSLRQNGTQNNKMYHLVVDPAPTAYTYTEAGQDDLGWDLSDASTIAFSANGTNWLVEMAIAWEDFNSTGTNSPGRLLGPPKHNTIWGAEFGRIHSTDDPPNNVAFSRWNLVSGGFRQRPFGTLTFKGGPTREAVDLSTGTVTWSTSFESPTYTAGQTISGIEGFLSAQPEIFQASTALPLTGAQSLEIVASASGRTLNQVQHTTNTATPQYMQYAMYIPYEEVIDSKYHHVLYIHGLYSHTSTPTNLGQIWFYNGGPNGSNNIGVVSFQNPITETATSTTQHMGQLAFDTWMWVTVKVDPVLNTFEVWIDDTKLTLPDGTDRFGVNRRSTFLQLAYGQIYSKNYGVESVFVDDLKYVEEQASRIDDWQLF